VIETLFKIWQAVWTYILEKSKKSAKLIVGVAVAAPLLSFLLVSYAWKEQKKDEAYMKRVQQADMDHIKLVQMAVLIEGDFKKEDQKIDSGFSEQKDFIVYQNDRQNQTMCRMISLVLEARTEREKEIVKSAILDIAKENESAVPSQFKDHKPGKIIVKKLINP